MSIPSSPPRSNTLPTSPSSSLVSNSPQSIVSSSKSSSSASRPPHVQPFWLGGAASMLAACCTHPLDLLKDGFFSLYNGLSASLLRQGTYSTVRFGAYEKMKAWRLEQLRQQHAVSASSSSSSPSSSFASSSRPPKDLPMYESIIFSLLSGSLGGVAGSPSDLVNVRMQNDRKLAPELRRNYRNIFHGLAVIARTEGVPALWNGVVPNVMRAALMTTGQLASYDFFKSSLCVRGGFSEKHIGTHLTASCLAGVVATVLTQPVDVIKTRIMNGGVRASTLQVARNMLANEGPQSFFKGFTPALTRLGPHTICTFIFLEQLKKLTM